MTMDPMDSYFYSLSSLTNSNSANSSLPSSDMDLSVRAVERIIKYSFKNKKLLEEALTHSSYTQSTSYQRLEFVGDAALGLALSNYVFLTYPDLDPGQLSLLRAANVCTEKLARVAVRHRIHLYIRHNANSLDAVFKEFEDAVSKEDDAVVYGGAVKAPKILADIVESVAAAVYVDVNFDLQRLWVVCRHLLEPIVTLEDLQQQPEPVSMLYKLCQKYGKRVDIKPWRSGCKNIASVYVDGQFVASGSSEQNKIARLNASKIALRKLTENMMPTNIGIDEDFEIENAMQKLQELCGKKKWPKPNYRIEKDEGPSHKKIFACSVQISTADGILYILGDEKSRLKDAKNSAASFLIRSLQEANSR